MPSIYEHTPICADCGVVMSVQKNGALAVELDDNWQPYKFYQMDVYRCNVCGHNVLTGAGNAQHASSMSATELADNMKKIEFQFI